MEIKQFNKLKEILKDEKSVLRLTLVLVTLISVLNFASIETVKNNERTIITPLNQSSQFWVSGNDASSEYLTSLGLYAVQLWQNYTPANAKQNFARLLELIDPNAYQNIKQQLKKKAALVEKYNRNAYSFEVTKTKVNRKTKQMMITGLKTRWTKSGVKPKQKVELVIDYQIDNATFTINSLKEKLL